MVERLDEERLETLRNWGAGLSTSARDELRAAGKAILMLVDEIDRLEADLWNARAEAKQAAAAAAAAAEQSGTEAERGTGAEAQAERPPRTRRTPVAEPAQGLALTLTERIARGRTPSEPAT